jgi:membrane-associated phospholipid phosphatase
MNKIWQSFLTFLKHLLSTHRAALVLLLIGVFFPLQIFGELAEDVWEDEGGFAWDEPMLLAIHTTANPSLDQVASILTDLGVYWGVFPAAIALMTFLFFRREWRFLAYFGITLLGSVAINRSAKVLLRRVRPHLWISPAPETDYGFPSGHAMSSMTFVAALVVLTWGTRWCKWVILLGGLFVLVIGWTRLYLGVHYPSDILAGWMASIAWTVGVTLLLRPHFKHHP